MAEVVLVLVFICLFSYSCSIHVFNDECLINAALYVETFLLFCYCVWQQLM